jgi:hypothetical protein
MHGRRRAARRRWPAPLAAAREEFLALAAPPLALSVLLPLFVLDLWLRAAQAAVFPAYRIAKPPRERYFSYDRSLLDYLDAEERLSCRACSYAHGVLAYAREAVARAEQYLCPVQNQRHPESPHSRYAHFAAYGDEAAYRRETRRLRAALRHPHHRGEP